MSQLNTLSWIQLSYLYHNKQIDESSLPSQLCIQLYDIFEFLNILLSSENIIENSNTFYKIYENRSLLWNYLHISTLNNSYDNSIFIFYWRKLSHLINNNKNLLNENMCNNFIIFCNNISAIFNIKGSLYDYNDLWVLGGHPILPKTFEYSNGLNIISKIFKSYNNMPKELEFYNLLFNNRNIFISNENIKKNIVEGYSTIYIENVKYDLSENNLQKDKFFYETLPNEITKEINSKIQDIENTYLSLIDKTQEFSSEIENNRLIYPKPDSLKEWCNIQMWGLYDILSIKEEYSKVNEIIQLIINNELPKSSDLFNFIKLLYKSSRIPQTIIPYQLLYFLSQAIESNSNQTDYNLIKSTIIYNSFNELILYWLKYQWNNYTDITKIDDSITPEITSIIQGERYYGKQKYLDNNNDIYPSPSYINHPIFVVQYLNTVKKLLYTNKSLSLVDLPYKKQEIKSIQEIMLNNIYKNEQILKYDENILNNLLLHTFLSIKSLISKENEKDYCIILNEIINHIPNNLSKIIEYLKNSDCERLSNITDKYIKPLFLLYLNEYNNESDKINSIKWIYLGCIRCLLLLPSLPIDPILIPQLQINVIDTELDKYCNEIEYRRWFMYIMYGGANNDNMKIYIDMENRIKKLQEKAKKIKSKVAIRFTEKENTKLFSDLYNELHQFFSSLASPDNIMEICSDLVGVGVGVGVNGDGDGVNDVNGNDDNGNDDNGNGNGVGDNDNMNFTNTNKINNAIQREENIQIAIDNFINRVSENYSCYYDITNPIFSALHYIKHGLNSLYHYNIYNTKYIQYNCEKSLFSQIILSILRLPILNNNLTEDIIKPFINLTQQTKFSKIQFIKIPLLLLTLYKITQGNFSADFLHSFDQLLSSFILQYKRKCDEIRKKKEEEESLIKTKVHKQMTTEEIEEIEMNKMFPDYKEKMENIIENDLIDENEKIDDDNSYSIDVNEKDILWLYTLHSLLFSKKEYSYTTIFKTIIYELYSNITPYLKDITLISNTNLDIYSQPLNIYFESVLEEYCEGSFIPSLSINKYIYDFRYDPNLPSLIEIYNPLINYQNRLLELLNEYPDNSNLQSMIKISNSILKLPLSSPIEQVLVGLQIIVQKSDVWQHVRSADSIEKELKEIQDLLIKYRREELKNYTNMLLFEEQNISKETANNFPTLYNIIFSKESQDNVNPSKKYNWLYLPKEFEWIFRKPKEYNPEKENETYIKEFYDTLEKYLSNSTYFFIYYLELDNIHQDYHYYYNL